MIIFLLKLEGTRCRIRSGIFKLVQIRDERKLISPDACVLAGRSVVQDDVLLGNLRLSGIGNVRQTLRIKVQPLQAGILRSVGFG